MIIVELEIENYKQFAGTHRIAFPQEGAVAVIGHNGAGKTTLFEAIEWALYGPRSIAAADIRPRQGTGDAPAVRVTLRTHDGKVYQVERKFRGRSKSAEAAIYELDADGEVTSTVVTGPKDVTARVSSTLVGLSHQAFVSTFFTRQKELSFFGDHRDADRRRQVSRLLGLETIRDAQEMIGADRRDSELTARGLRAQYEHETGSRDFAAERVARAAELDEATGRVEEAEQAIASRRSERDQAEQAERYWLDLEQQDAALSRQIMTTDGLIATATDRRQSLDRQLAQMDEREAELARLDPVAAREGDLRAETERWARERERAAQLRTLQRRLDEIATQRAGRVRALRQVTGSVETVPGWAWLAADDTAPARGARRLHALAVAVDTRGARDAADAIARAAAAETERAAAADHAAKCRTHLPKLRAQLDGLFVDGDPAAAIKAAEQRKAMADAEWSQASGIIKGFQMEVDKLRQSIDRLRSEGEGTCPTCGQPIDEIVIRTLQTGIDERDREIARLQGVATAGRKASADADRDIASARKRNDDVILLRERIQTGETMTREAEEKEVAADRALATALAAAALDRAPAPDAVETARARFDALSTVAAQADRLGDLAEGLREDDERDNTTRAEIAELGEVAYDESAHQAAQAALSDARTAAGQATEIRRALAQRPVLQADREATDAAIATHQAERQRLVAERQRVGFDADSLASARAHMRDCHEAMLAATNRLNAEQMAERDARAALEKIDADEQRVAGIAERAGEAEAAMDQLQQMYRGFDDFERWVAQRMNPLLADRAGEILREVTNGAYDQVRFDDNYGLHIFDGDEDFPVSQFSGGERDVASLAARLALSRLIAAQAAHPPAFIVLDEVFGSLDQERRGRLLSMLDVLTNEDTEGFRQLFVISHVDDVRQSQAFDEVWRIQADAQGVSQWENLQQTGGVEEL
ncbi:MAG TPA: SMC family ATPase [Thermomicrobiales bacterium]|jgi:exonuclease SbcC|nr:SMC family ATPase [Thermomicrobiales bacterium]